MKIKRNAEMTREIMIASVRLAMILAVVIGVMGCGQSQQNQITVIPSIKSLTPSEGFQSTQNLTIEVLGENTHFTAGVTRLTFSGSGVTAESVNVIDSTHLSANVEVNYSAEIGLREVIIISNDEVLTVTGGFTVKLKEDYFPSDEGDAWHYSGTDGSSQIMTVEGTTQVGANTVQILKSSYTPPTGFTTTGESYFKKDNSGVYLFSAQTTEVFTYLSFPLEIGKSWTSYNYSPFTQQATVLARENVTVPAGTFSCYKIGYVFWIGTVEADTQYIWFGDKAGMVKRTSSSSTVEAVLDWKNF